MNNLSLGRLRPAIAILLLISMVLMFLVTSVSANQEADNASAHTPNELGLQVKSAFLIDADTGQVLFEANADVPLPPASMSKMMTEYIVLEEIEKGNLSWDEVITTGHNAATTTREGSHVFLAQGDKHTVKELYIAMAVGSANDATISLAERISGTEEAFARRMNETALELGLETAHFINSTGLSRADMSQEYQPSSIDGETVMSAKDAGMLAYHILQRHENFLEYSSITAYKFRERDKDPLRNNNLMLQGNIDSDDEFYRQFVYEGLDGMKTGYTSSAKYCFTGTAERDGTRLISVVMGADTMYKRFYETAKLLDYGFNNFEMKTVVSPKVTVEDAEKVIVKKGVQIEVPIVTESGINYMVKKGVEPNIEIIETKILPPDQLVAPIAQNTVVGSVTYQYTPEVGEPLVKTVNLITTEEVEKGSWWRLLLRGIKDFFVSLFNGIVDLF